jgi:putative endonuclease
MPISLPDNCEHRSFDFPWWVYVLECADGTLYTGITTDVRRRLAQHNGELAGGARCTRARRPVRLAYAEPQSDRSAAARREVEIKRLRVGDKRALVAGWDGEL